MKNNLQILPSRNYNKKIGEFCSLILGIGPIYRFITKIAYVTNLQPKFRFGYFLKMDKNSVFNRFKKYIFIITLSALM